MDDSPSRRCAPATVRSAEASIVAVLALIVVALVDWRLECRYLGLLDGVGQRAFWNARVRRWQLFVVGFAATALLGTRLLDGRACSATTLVAARLAVGLFGGLALAQLGDALWRPDALGATERDLFCTMRRERLRSLTVAVVVGGVALCVFPTAAA